MLGGKIGRTGPLRKAGNPGFARVQIAQNTPKGKGKGQPVRRTRGQNNSSHHEKKEGRDSRPIGLNGLNVRRGRILIDIETEKDRGELERGKKKARIYNMALKRCKTV